MRKENGRLSSVGSGRIKIGRKGRVGIAEPFSLIKEESHSQNRVVKSKSSFGRSENKNAGESLRFSGNLIYLFPVLPVVVIRH